MNVLGALDAISQFSQRVSASSVGLDNTACLHSLHNAIACGACVGVCPTDALHIDDGHVRLDDEKCVGCAACTHVCPVTAIRGATRVDRLLRYVEEQGAAENVELVCPYREEITHQFEDNAAVFVTPHCLAALAPSTYVELANRGVRHITLRLNACTECPIGSVASAIQRTARTAAVLLESPPTTSITLTTSEPVDGHITAQIHDTRRTVLSRRGLFQLFTRQISETAADLLPLEMPPALTPEQQRLLPALAERAAQTGQVPAWAPALSAGANCNGCGVCARLCPTDALSFDSNDAQFRLRFAAAHCTGCRLCVVGCPQKALNLMPERQPAEPAAASPATLVEGELQTCQRCRTTFHTVSGETLCPACAFRRRNPFGSHIVQRGVERHHGG